MNRYRPSLEDSIRYADQIIAYYQRPLSSNPSFGLGLRMAEQWRAYLVEDQHDLQQLRAFARALEDDAGQHGSAWHDLSLQVKWWLDALEEGVAEPYSVFHLK